MVIVRGFWICIKFILYLTKAFDTFNIIVNIVAEPIKVNNGVKQRDIPVTTPFAFYFLMVINMTLWTGIMAYKYGNESLEIPNIKRISNKAMVSLYESYSMYMIVIS